MQSDRQEIAAACRRQPQSTAGPCGVRRILAVATQFPVGQPRQDRASCCNVDWWPPAPVEVEAREEDDLVLTFLCVWIWNPICSKVRLSLDRSIQACNLFDEMCLKMNSVCTSRIRENTQCSFCMAVKHGSSRWILHAC